MGQDREASDGPPTQTTGHRSPRTSLSQPTSICTSVASGGAYRGSRCRPSFLASPGKGISALALAHVVASHAEGVHLRSKVHLVRRSPFRAQVQDSSSMWASETPWHFAQPIMARACVTASSSFTMFAWQTWQRLLSAMGSAGRLVSSSSSSKSSFSPAGAFLPAFGGAAAFPLSTFGAVFAGARRRRFFGALLRAGSHGRRRQRQKYPRQPFSHFCSAS